MQLLTRDPTRRLGSGKSDAEEIKRHPFFKDVNFDDVLHKRIPPPYFPTIVRLFALRTGCKAELIRTERECRYQQLRRRVHEGATDTHPSAYPTVYARPGRVQRLLLGSELGRHLREIRPPYDTYYVLPVLSHTVHFVRLPLYLDTCCVHDNPQMTTRPRSPDRVRVRIHMYMDQYTAESPLS